MNRTKKFFLNSISAIALQFVNLIIGLILPIIMIKCYGSEANGLITSITQFISYFNLVEAGLASAAIFSLYKPLADNDHEKINQIVSTTKKLYFSSGFIFVFLVFGLAISYLFLIETNIFSNMEIFFLVVILGGSGFLDFFTLSKYRVLLTADQKLYMISISSIIYYIINAIILILLANLNFNIIVARLVALVAIVIRSLILHLYVRKNYKYVNYNSETNKNLIDKRQDALFLQILGSIQNAAPVIMLTIFCDLTVVSVYSIYNMVLQGINSLLSIFTSGLPSSFGDVIARKQIKLLQKASQEFEYIYYNILTVIYSCTLLLILPFVKLYTSGITDTNYYFPVVGILFVINGLLYNLKTPQGMLVISSGMYKETKWQSTIQGLLIIIFGLIFIPKFGIVGALIASIISNLYRDIDLLFFIPRKVTHNPVIYTFIRQLKILIIGCFASFCCYKINYDINNYFDWIIYALICFGITFLILLLFDFIFERKKLKQIIVRIKLIIGGKK